MEQLISEIEAHIARFGGTPQKLLRDVINARWGQWDDWKAGRSSPTMKSADRIRAHMQLVEANHDFQGGDKSPDLQGNLREKSRGAA